MASPRDNLPPVILSAEKVAESSTKKVTESSQKDGASNDKSRSVQMRTKDSVNSNKPIGTKKLSVVA